MFGDKNVTFQAETSINKVNEYFVTQWTRVNAMVPTSSVSNERLLASRTRFFESNSKDNIATII